MYSIYTSKHRTAGKQDFSVKVLMYIPFHEKASLKDSTFEAMLGIFRLSHSHHVIGTSMPFILYAVHALLWNLSAGPVQ